jgi:cytochrome c oxidase cbb3-type subunit 3
MSSRFPTRLAAAAALALGLSACHRPPPAHGASAPMPELSQLYPGEAPAPQPSPALVAFQGDPGHIANGKRYFSAYNCNGCHFNGGGGIGPAFMHQNWRYGGSLQEIHDSIAEGRPNGMPVWARKIPDAQIWEIAAYVHSLATGAQTGDNPPPPPVTAPVAQPGQAQTPAGA